MDASFALYLTNFQYFIDLLCKCIKELVYYLNELEQSIKTQTQQKAQNIDHRREDYKANVAAGKEGSKVISKIDMKGSRWRNLQETGMDVQKFFYLDKNPVDQQIVRIKLEDQLKSMGKMSKGN